MRRIMIGFLAVVVVVASVGAISVKRVLDQERVAEADIRQTIVSGVEAALGGLVPQTAFRMVVVGVEPEPGLHEFRAQAVTEATPSAVFGVARSGCADDPTPDCWQIVRLEIDGRDMAEQLGLLGPTTETVVTEPLAVLTEPEDVEPLIEPLIEDAGDGIAVSPSDLSATDVTPSTEVDTLVDVVEPVPAADSAQPSEVAALADNPTDGALTTGTHKVRLRLINARSSPTVEENNILAKLRSGTELQQISSDGSWGEFVVLNGGRQGMIVWVSFSVLDEM